MCNFGHFSAKNTLQLHSGGLQQLPIVPKIGVHSSWSGENVVGKKLLNLLRRYRNIIGIPRHRLGSVLYALT